MRAGQFWQTKAMHRRLQMATVTVALIMPGAALGQSLSAPGRVQNVAGMMSIGIATSGLVKDILAHEGDHVSAGQLLLTMRCEPLEAEAQVRTAQLAAAQAVFDRVLHGPRPEEITVAEAVVGYATARAEEAQKTYERTQALKEGISVTTARILETLRDARVFAAQLGEAKAKLALLRAGSREEDIREARFRHDTAEAQLEEVRAQLDQCFVRAPTAGVVVDVFASAGEFVSLAVPVSLMKLMPDANLKVRAEIASRDFRRVCVGQRASVHGDGIARAGMPTRVETVNPVIGTRTLFPAGNEDRTPDVVRVILSFADASVGLPVGLPVNVQFETCPSN
jgi:HlyD family secretion protein